MRVFHRDMRHGVVKLRVDNLDDLWYLSQVVEKGDLVRGETARRVKDREDTKSSGGERRIVTLGLRVEKTEFKADTSSLRVSGVIEEGPEDVVALGSHHTLNVGEGTVVTCVKQSWSKVSWEIINGAVNSTLRPKVLVVSVDEGEATAGLLRDSGIQYTELSRNIGGKYDLKGRAERKADFYGELTLLVENILAKENVSGIILAGAGFEKDNYFAFLKERRKELAARCAVENTGSCGRNAISEAVKKPALKRIVEDASSAVDLRLMDELLSNIGKDSGLAVYGLRDVEAAVDSGAVGVLLTSDGAFFNERGRLEKLMRQVMAGRGKTHIINKDGEAGRQLDSLGGVAAILRYRMSY